jgi:predicted kinase
MEHPKLYLFVGYPGAGKTTVAKMIAETTSAQHLWADVERHKLFPVPTHSLEESSELYDKLNKQVDGLLAQGKSVVFDTNFNYARDRQKLREIAHRHDAETIIIWVNTPQDIARERAVKSHSTRNLYNMSMSDEQFDAIASKLEPPTPKEHTLKIDGTIATKDQILQILGIS